MSRFDSQVDVFNKTPQPIASWFSIDHCHYYSARLIETVSLIANVALCFNLANGWCVQTDTW